MTASGNSDLNFSAADYAVFVTMMVVSFAIGIYHAVKSANNKEGQAHFDSDEIESNLSVPGIRGFHENALCKSLEMSPPPT